MKTHVIPHFDLPPEQRYGRGGRERGLNYTYGGGIRAGIAGGRAVIDRLEVEERGAAAPVADRVPRHELDHAIQIRDQEISHLKEDLSWTRGELAERSRQHELLIQSIPLLLPPGRPEGVWAGVKRAVFGEPKKE